MAFSSQEEICMIKSINRRGNSSVSRYATLQGFILYRQTILCDIFTFLTCFFRWSYGICTKLPQQCLTFTRLGSYIGKILCLFSFMLLRHLAGHLTFYFSFLIVVLFGNGTMFFFLAEISKL